MPLDSVGRARCVFLTEKADLTTRSSCNLSDWNSALVRLLSEWAGTSGKCRYLITLGSILSATRSHCASRHSPSQRRMCEVLLYEFKDGLNTYLKASGSAHTLESRRASASLALPLGLMFMGRPYSEGDLLGLRTRSNNSLELGVFASRIWILLGRVDCKYLVTIQKLPPVPLRPSGICARGLVEQLPEHQRFHQSASSWAKLIRHTVDDVAQDHHRQPWDQTPGPSVTLRASQTADVLLMIVSPRFC